MFAEEAIHFGEEVECAIGHSYFESRYFARETHYEVASALEGLTHVAYALLRACVGCFCGLHGNGATATGVLALELLTSLDNPRLCCHPSDTPTGHRVGFADAVDEDDALLEFRELGKGEMFADVVDVLVDFVADNQQFRMLEEHLLEGRQLFARIDASGGIAGRAEDEGLAAGCDSLFQLFRRHLEMGLDAAGHKHGLGFGQFDHFGVANPTRGREDTFVSRVENSEYGVTKGLFAAGGDDDLLGGILQAVFFEQFLTDGLAQGGITRHGCIERDVVVYGLFGCGFDMVRSVKIGLSERE